MTSVRLFLFSSIFLTLLLTHTLGICANSVQSHYTTQALDAARLTVKDIIIEGNKTVQTQAILNKITLSKNQLYSAANVRQTLLEVQNMNYFKTAHADVEIDQNDADHVTLYIVVEEKMPLKEMIFKGNKALSTKDITKKIAIDEITHIDESDAQKYSMILKKLYAEKNYHDVIIKHEFIEQDSKITAIFTIQEHKKTCVIRVLFKGNTIYSDKKLRSLLLTKEDWILNFMDHAGAYHPDILMMDRQSIESFYQSNGYFNAKVTNVSTQINDKTKQAIITFSIFEGDVYNVGSIGVQSTDTTYELQKILPVLPLQVGLLYSKELVKNSMDIIRAFWSSQGYLYADVAPGIEVNQDDKTIAITFFVEPGQQVHIKRINIFGNQKTRDKVIRRTISLKEGQLLTDQQLEISKSNIESLGYFDQHQGVSYKIVRLPDNTADVDFMVKEVKTGRFELQLGTGGAAKDISNPASSLSLGCSISDRNLFGRGIGFNFNGSVSKEEQQIGFNITQPYVLDRPLYAAIDGVFKHSSYADFKFTKDDIKERMASLSISSGFISNYLRDTKFIAQIGAEDVRYSKKPDINVSQLTDPQEQIEFRDILQKRFTAGTFIWTGIQIAQDCRNSPMHTSQGYQWLIQNKLGLPGLSSSLGFWKIDCDASWYYPLIDERGLVLYVHTHFGATGSFSDKYSVPYRELFHIGGPASVRGYTFGQVGPLYKNNDSVGGKKAFWINTELIFPIAPDYAIKGAFFYDGGSGWDTPQSHAINKNNLRNNSFDYRQSIGFGLRIYRPSPIKVDWGFKLDRRKGESMSEVHFTMAHDF